MSTSMLSKLVKTCTFTLFIATSCFCIPKKYILTGGPGVGKTTLLSELRNRGFAIVQESATTIIEQDIKKGLPNPAVTGDIGEFQERVWRYQLELEQAVEDEARVFLDRSIIDGLAYNEFYHVRIHPDLIPTIKKTHYDLVFILDFLDFTDNNEVRTEDHETAQTLHGLVNKHYESFGYKPIVVPVFLYDDQGRRLSVEDSVSIRADFVCEIIENFDSKPLTEEFPNR